MPGSTWTLVSVNATGSGPSSASQHVPLLLANNSVASRIDVFVPAQAAWVLHDSAGLALQPAGAPSYLGSSLRGFSVAVWFRVDDSGASNPRGNTVLQLALPQSRGLVLTLVAKYSAVFTLGLHAGPCCGASNTSTADYAASTSSDFGQSVSARPNGGAFAVGLWQHAAFSFDSTGVQNGLFWNGKQQLLPNGTARLSLASLVGSPSPYGPLASGSLGYDASWTVGARGGFYPLWGAVSDVQFYDFTMSQAMANGLYTGATTAACIPPPPPPRPPLPSPPRPPRVPEAPPSRPPLQLSYCVAGYTTVSILSYNASLLNGTSSYLQVLPSYIQLVNVSTGCDVPIPPSRRRLHTFSPPPSLLGNCTNSSGLTCVNGTAVVNASMTYNSSNCVTVTLSLDPVVASSPAVLSRILALSNASSAGPPPAAAALAGRLRSAGMTAVTGAALTSATSTQLAAKANASAAGLAQLAATRTNHTNFNAVVQKAAALSRGQAAAVAAAGGLAGLAALWVAVHANCMMQSFIR